MAHERGGISGQWFGVVAISPNVAFIEVTFTEESDGMFSGSWVLPDGRGTRARGAFRARRFAEFLSVLIRTKPLAHVQCQMTILEEGGESMITGVIPFPGAVVPFLTVTLFRTRLQVARDGICPVITEKYQ